MVIVTVVIVVMRYVFDAGAVWLQESVVWMHAVVFMVGAAYTLQQEDHVRVDIFYRDRSERYRHAVNLAGTILFLVPFSVFLLYIGWDYVAFSWANREGSGEAGGLPAVWLLKSLILVLPALLLLQSVSTVRHCLAGLRRGRGHGAS